MGIRKAHASPSAVAASRMFPTAAQADAEIVERTLVGGAAQRTVLLPEERQDEAVALHEHPLLFGQRVDEHGVFVFVHRFCGGFQPVC